MTVKGWANQQKIHALATGGFINHCGWNSATKVASQGIPILACPLHGDQKVNALEKAGLGIMEKAWGIGNERLVKEEEIDKKIMKIMDDAELRSGVRKAVELGRSSTKAMMDVIVKLSLRIE